MFTNILNNTAYNLYMLLVEKADLLILKPINEIVPGYVKIIT